MSYNNYVDGKTHLAYSFCKGYCSKGKMVFVAIQMRLNLQALFVKNLFIERHLLAEK